MNCDKKIDELEKIDSVQLMDLLKKVEIVTEKTNFAFSDKIETSLIPAIYDESFIVRELKAEDSLQFSELNIEFNLIMNEFDPLYGNFNNNPFLDNRENIIYVTEIAGKITGYLLARFYTGFFKRDDYICCIEKIYVHPKYRKNSMGKSLVNNLYDYANSKGAEKVAAMIMPENIIAEQIFNRLDFIRIRKEIYAKEIQKTLKIEPK